LCYSSFCLSIFLIFNPYNDSLILNYKLLLNLVHEGAEELAGSFEDDQIAQVVDQVLDYDVNQDGMIDYQEFNIAQNLAQKKNTKKKCESCGDRDD